MQGPFSANHIKRHPSFIHVQDCLGDLLIYEVVPIGLPPPPLEQTVCCLCSPVMAWSSRWGGFVWPWVVWRTPPLILPFESLQRTMANTCEPPKCSIGKKSLGGGGLGVSGAGGKIDECWRRGECGRSSAMCLRTSFSHRCLGYMSCFTNGLGVLSPVLPSFVWGWTEFMQTRTDMKIHKSQPWGFFFQQGDRQHSTQHLSDHFFSIFIDLCFSDMIVCAFICFPHCHK